MREVLFIALFTFILLGIAQAQGPELIPVDEEITDLQVLQLVDTDYPGLEQFAAAMQAGDQQKATALLIDHFVSRDKPVLPESNFPGLGDGNSTCVLRMVSKAQADEKWMKHIFSISNNDIGKSETYELGPEIKWMESPSEAKSTQYRQPDGRAVQQYWRGAICRQGRRVGRKLGDTMPALVWSHQEDRAMEVPDGNTQPSLQLPDRL
jgi:hypothetical protein